MADPPWKKQSAAPAPVFNLGPPVKRGEIIGICGPGGSGKSTLACLIERTCGPTAVIDLDDSMPVLYDRLEEMGVAPLVASGIGSWRPMVDCMQSSAFDAVNNVILDTTTEAQNLAVTHTVDTVPTDSGRKATSIESYGYGKGARYLHDTWLDLRYACKALAANGKNVILVMHDVVAKVPNPDGADFIRFEPNLYQDSSVSLRRTTRDFLDHLFFIAYDVDANGPGKGDKHGKATGSGSRTIYCSETATCMAKSRRLSDPIPYELGDDALWRALFSFKQKETTNAS